MKFSRQIPGQGPLGKYFFPAVLLSAGVLVPAQLLLPAPYKMQCLFRRWSGLPCPLCGATRCIELILGGEWLSAFQTQPLVFVLFFCGGAVLVGLSLAGLCGFPVVRMRPEHCRERFAVVLSIMLLIMLNWAYLILSR